MSAMFEQASTRLVDLSIGMESGVVSEPWPPEIEAFDHKQGAQRLAENLQNQGYDISVSDFPDGIGLAWEEITSIPHAGTHMDAPWHYGPETDGEQSKTIDEVPLEWCIGEAVVLDFTWKEPRTEITTKEVIGQIETLNYELTPGEIVLIETGADELWGSVEYLTEYLGMGQEATKYLVNNGIKVIGTDAYGFDKPFVEMGRRYMERGDTAELWPAHFAGRDVEYCQIEKMANLDKLPRRTNVPIATFPIKLKGASGAWVRPVAIIPDNR